MTLRRSALALIGLSLMLLAAARPAESQQQTAQPPTTSGRGSITGIVRDAETNQPLSNVAVQIAGSSLGNTSGADGRYTITGVSPGIVSLTVKRVGYSPQAVENLRVAAGAATTRDIVMQSQALILTGVVTTGVSDPTSGTRAPFSVSKLSPEQLQVASLGSPLETLAGKVAGLSVVATSGAPGSDVVIQIRNPLSIRGNTQPMIIIDGVIQMQDDPSIDARSITGNPIDIPPENIESMEIVRGAAAAAIYGQRAANGVINITTKRGADVALGTARFTVSNETGFQRLGKFLPIVQTHRFLVDDNNQFIDTFGRPITDRQFVNDPDQIFDNRWGVPTYDNVQGLFKTGYQINASAQLAQSTLSNNFSISGGSQQQTGVVKTPNGGLSSQNIAMSLDHRAGQKIGVGLGIAYNRQFQRLINNGTAIFSQALELTPDVNMHALDPATGDYFPFPDSRDDDIINPLYFEPKRDRWERRIGVNVNGQASYRPTSIITFTAQGGYLRQDRENQLQWLPRNFLQTDNQPSFGQYDVAADLNEGFNTRTGVNLLTGFGAVTFRSNLAFTSTIDRRHGFSVSGDTLVVNAPDLDFTRRQEATENKRDVRSMGFTATAGFDYNQKIIGDLVYRRDGNSLLPPVNRWRGNGRASFAYVLSEEPWWPLPDLSLVKPRYSIGTAGNNPLFDAQYETYLQNNNTERIFKEAMGNNEIKPEEVTEQEFGLDLALRNRYSVSLNYVRTTTKNVIRPDTIVSYTGFDTQESNLGDLRGDFYEATFEAQWFNSRDFRWSSTLIADRGRTKITSYPRQCQGANTTTNLERQCAGYVFGQMYGFRHITDPADLNPRHFIPNTAGRNSLDQFDINDDGLVVPVGRVLSSTGDSVGGSWTDMRWGQNVNIDGVSYAWGIPLRVGVYDANNTRTGSLVHVIGQGLPDLHFGFGNQLTLGRWSAHVQMDGQLGGQIFNREANNRVNDGRHPMLDQSGKPIYAKKPNTYYTQANVTASGTAGLTEGDDDAHLWFLEDGDYLKVTEFRLAYRLDQGLPLLRSIGMTSGQVALVARNLLTITGYSGIDPQISGGAGTTTARVDDTNYPRFRTISASIRLIF